MLSGWSGSYKKLPRLTASGQNDCTYLILPRPTKHNTMLSRKRQAYDEN
jgi:hypothetical protein